MSHNIIIHLDVKFPTSHQIPNLNYIKFYKTTIHNNISNIKMNYKTAFNSILYFNFKK